MLRGCSKRFTQTGNVPVDHALVPVEIRAPYPLDEQVARHRASLFAQQQLEYLRLLGTQIYRVAVHRYRTRGRIHQDIRVSELTRAQPQPAGPPHERLCLCHQHRKRKRLGDIIVRARAEPCQRVALLPKCCDENDRNVALLPHCFADLQPVQMRHHHIQHQQVERLRLCQHERLFAVIRRCYRHACCPKEILHQRG